MNNINFKTVSLNIRGLHQEKKRRSLFKRLKDDNIQICFLQETYSTPDVERRWRNEWGGKMVCVHGTNHARGVMILFKPGTDADILNVHQDDIGRVLLVEVKIQDVSFKLMNVYSPNCENSQVQFYNFLKKFMGKHIALNDNVILGGDFNLILDINMDRKGGSHRNTHQYRQILHTLGMIKSNYELTDIWRNKNPSIKRFTWRRKYPQPVSSRLDYWFISNSLADCVENVDILPSFYSDHSEIFLHLKGFESNSVGRGYWKLNNTFLDEQTYIRGITEGIPTWLQELTPDSDSRSKWEYIKFRIKEFSSTYGKKRAKERAANEKELRAKLHDLEKKVDSNTDEREGVDLNHELDTTKAKLTEIDYYKSQGLILRSRVNCYEKGEKSTQFFLNLESRNRI